MSETAADTPAGDSPAAETPATPPTAPTRPGRAASRNRSAAATSGKPAAREPRRGLHDAAEKLAPVRPAPVERPYSEAVTAEQLQAMRDHGLA